MRTYKTTVEDFDATVEIPDVWLNRHWVLYQRAYWSLVAEIEDVSIGEAQVAGAIALIASGEVVASIPGLDIDNTGDLGELSAQSLAVLRRGVILSIEQTQNVPLELVEPSGNGSTAKAKSK